MFQAGAWGIFRVAPWKSQAQRYPDTVAITNVTPNSVSGFTTPCPVAVPTACEAGGYVSEVKVGNYGSAKVTNGVWTLNTAKPITTVFDVTSPAGGVATWGIVPNVSAPAAEADVMAHTTGSSARPIPDLPRRLPRGRP
jgi:hypothetical protein